MSGVNILKNVNTLRVNNTQLLTLSGVNNVVINTLRVNNTQLLTLSGVNILKNVNTFRSY